MPGRLRKWTAGEDRLLLDSVKEYTAMGSAPDYRDISKKICHRSPKQCRERYENSLQPDVKRGEWSIDETITLARLMCVHGQNWAAIKDQVPTRTYNAVKKKGRKLLGEIVDRNSIPKGTRSKAPSNWPSSETRELLKAHKDSNLSFEKRFNFLFLALHLRTGRSEAEIERQLLQTCDCGRCVDASYAIDAFCTDFVSRETGKFKEKWSLWKASQILKSLEAGEPVSSKRRNSVVGYGSKYDSFKNSRRLSTISSSSASTMATDISSFSAPKRFKPQSEDIYSIGLPAFEIKDECSEISLDLDLINSFPEPEFNSDLFKLDLNSPIFTQSPKQGLKEFDLSFLLPL